jgi:hypothetical protein
MRFYRISALPLILLAGTASAGTGISTSTFTIPNETGQTVNGLAVTLTGPTSSLSVESTTFGSPSSSSAPTFDFSGASLLAGASDTLTAQAYPESAGDTAIGIDSFYWTYNGSQVGDTYQPLEPEFVFSISDSVVFANNAPSSESYTDASLTVNGTPIDLTGDSTSVSPSGTVTLDSGPVDSAAMSFFDIFTDISFNVNFTASPEPGTLPLMAVVLLGGGLAFVRFRRARA